MVSILSNTPFIPEPMRALDQWVVWKYEERNGKRTKPPLQLDGTYAKVNDPSTWCSFAEASNACDTMDGIGFVYAEGDGLVGIDLDHCINPYTGELDQWAADIVAWFTDSYVEYSPSGEGLHIICEGRAIATGSKKWKVKGQEMGLEVYDFNSPRYFTVTGNVFNDKALANCQDGLERLYGAYFAERDQGPATTGAPPRKFDEAALIDALHCIQSDDYQTWIRVGMALKSGGYSCDLWDQWSGNSPKYQPGACDRKWKTFRSEGVGVGSIFHMAGKRYVYEGTPNRFQQGPNTQTSAPNTQVDLREQEPDDFHVSEWPVLKEEALHGLVGRIVAASVASSEADPAAVLATLLVRAGATFGRKSWTKIGDDRHYPLLFGMVVGASANARKGTSLGPIERIFEDAEARLATPSLTISNGLSSGEGLIASVRDGKAATKDEDADEGIVDKRLLVVESEFAGALRAMQRQGNTLSVAIRDAWDRRKLSIMTKNNPLVATDVHIGLLGHITKHELAKLLEKVELSNGLVNRFLWFCSRRSKILAFPEGLNEALIPNLAHDLKEAITHSQKERVMHFDAEAGDYYRALYYRVTMQESGGIIGDITARGPAQIRRLALIYSLLDCDTMIRLVHLKAANAVWDYCLASAKWIFGASTTHHAPTESLNDRLLAALQSGAKTQNELTTGLKNVAKASAIASALSELQSIGRVSQEKGESKGGRAPIVWRLVEMKG